MKIDGKDPNSDAVMIAFNGEIVGFVLEADDEAGYIVQCDFDWPTQTFRGQVRKEGKVCILGNCDTDSRETLLDKFNKHRADCGLGPFEAAA